MMTDVTIVTSCSAQGWEDYGARFVSTFKKYWPKSIKLVLVSEAPLLYELDGVSQRFIPLLWSQSWASFSTQNVALNWTKGDASCPRPPGIAPHWRETTGYNFRYDAYKFAKKVFAIELVAKDLSGGKLCWVDADVLTHAPVPEGLIERLLPQNYALSCLARHGYHSECGFVGYNLDNSAARMFITEFANLYVSGAVYKLHEWHDSWVFDWLRNNRMVPTYNIPHKSKGHPFINSELGLYMDHLKGKRKALGHSNVVEQVAHRKTPYWQGGRT